MFCVFEYVSQLLAMAIMQFRLLRVLSRDLRFHLLASVQQNGEHNPGVGAYTEQSEFLS